MGRLQCRQLIGELGVIAVEPRRCPRLLHQRTIPVIASLIDDHRHQMLAHQLQRMPPQLTVHKSNNARCHFGQFLGSVIGEEPRSSMLISSDGTVREVSFAIRTHSSTSAIVVGPTRT